MDKHRSVFLDRDGVINRAIVRNGKPYPPDNVRELQILPKVEEALNLLNSGGFLLIVVTNQPDVAKGKQKREVVEEINALLSQKLPIDDIFVCYHSDEDQCNCRKPNPGLLLQASQKYVINFENSYLVGDRWKDIEAGRMVGCKTFFIDYGYLEPKPDYFDFQVGSLFEAAKMICKMEEEKRIPNIGNLQNPRQIAQ